MTAKLDTAAFCELVTRGELICLEIRHPLFSADLMLQGAQLISYIPTGSDDWLWLSEDVEYLRGTSLRGGIPICWPWFGNADKNPDEVQACMNQEAKLPAHGFARSKEWQLVNLQEAVDQVLVTMILDTTSGIPALWKTAMSLKADFLFTGHEVTVTLTTTNNGSDAISFSQALHTYFPTKDILDVSISGLEGSWYYDGLDNWQSKTQSEAVSFSAETDRVYQDCRSKLTLVSSDTRTTIQTEGSSSAIVWNPWIEKSKRLGQFPDDGWQKMFCVETANAMNDAVKLTPGGSHSLSLTLSR